VLASVSLPVGRVGRSDLTAMCNEFEVDLKIKGQKGITFDIEKRKVGINNLSLRVGFD
jgi:hypothetical protein